MELCFPVLERKIYVGYSGDVLAFLTIELSSNFRNKIINGIIIVII